MLFLHNNISSVAFTFTFSQLLLLKRLTIEEKHIYKAFHRYELLKVAAYFLTIQHNKNNTLFNFINPLFIHNLLSSSSGISNCEEIGSFPEHCSSGISMATGTAVHNLQHCPDERTGQGEGGPATGTIHAVTMQIHICSILDVNCFDLVALFIWG